GTRHSCRRNGSPSAPDAPNVTSAHRGGAVSKDSRGKSARMLKSRMNCRRRARTANATLVGTNQYRQTFCDAVAVHSLPQNSFAPIHGMRVPFELASCPLSVQHG